MSIGYLCTSPAAHTANTAPAAHTANIAPVEDHDTYGPTNGVTSHYGDTEGLPSLQSQGKLFSHTGGTQEEDKNLDVSSMRLSSGSHRISSPCQEPLGASLTNVPQAVPPAQNLASPEGQRKARFPAAGKTTQERTPYHHIYGQPLFEREQDPNRTLRRQRLATLDTGIRPRTAVPTFCNSLLAAPLNRTAEDQRGYDPSLQASQRPKPVYSSQASVGHLEEDAQELIEWRNRNLVDTQRHRQRSITAAEKNALPVVE